MNRAQLLGSATAAIAVIALIAGCAGGEEPTDAAATQPAATASATPAEATPEQAAQEAPTTPQAAAEGEYIDYAQYQSDAASYAAGDVVLFFNASWCPTCKAAEANFTDAAFPAGLTVVSVDYDDNTALRQQYGVTVQHTFVQVDADGNEVAKWTGSSTVEQVAEQVV